MGSMTMPSSVPAAVPLQHLLMECTMIQYRKAYRSPESRLESPIGLSVPTC